MIQGGGRATYYMVVYYHYSCIEVLHYRYRISSATIVK
jgi:hypothetical protein